MKKTTVLVTFMAVLVLGVSMTFANNSAEVNKDVGCNLVDAEGNLFFAPESGHQVLTNSAKDNSKITCHAQLPEGQVPPEKAIHWNFDNTNMLCSTGAGFTDDWKGVVTPSGNVMLTCHYKTP